MAVTFKMKFFLVWICLISEAFPFPIQSPDVDKTNVCCVENPKLVYQGHDSNRGINVYVFEFLPENKEAKDKIVEDTTMKNDLPNNRNVHKGIENRENHEDMFITTNKPVIIYGKRKTPDTETSTRDNTHVPDLQFDTINNTINAAQSDIEMYEDMGLSSNATEGLQRTSGQTRDVQKTNRYSNGEDYYGTEGSALLDIPGYNDTYTSNQGQEVDLTPTVKNDINNLGCSESEGQCKNQPKQHIFVTQPTTHIHSKNRKDSHGAYVNRKGNTINPTVKWSMKPTKPSRHKSKKQDDSNVNKKGISIRHIIGKILQFSGGQRRKISANRSSSSESRSDSSQEFD